jgi:hypothetical protein
MADPTALYSYKGETPRPLPNKIRLNDGTAPSDPSTFTDEQIAESGFTGPYVVPDYDQTYQRMYWDSEKLEYIIEDIQRPGFEMTEQEVWAGIRNVRNILLQESDWTILPDSPLTDKQRQAAIIYRQKLRDHPSTITDIMALKEELINSDIAYPVFKSMPPAPSFIVSPRD